MKKINEMTVKLSIIFWFHKYEWKPVYGLYPIDPEFTQQ
jgi:hypothetical protein